MCRGYDGLRSHGTSQSVVYSVSLDNDTKKCTVKKHVTATDPQDDYCTVSVTVSHLVNNQKPECSGISSNL